MEKVKWVQRIADTSFLSLACLNECTKSVNGAHRHLGRGDETY